MCVCQVAWAPLDADVHVTKPNSRIIKWLKASNRRVMERLLKDKLFFLDGWNRPEAGSQGTPRPTYAETDFKVICPVASGHLPVRKEWLDMMMQKYTLESTRTMLEEHIAEHNKIHNPSGEAHDSTASNKRSASSAGLDSQRQTHGTVLPEVPGAPKNEAELTQADGPLTVLETQGQKLYFTKSGRLWLWGQVDDTMRAGLCLVLVFGLWFINEDVQKEKAKQKKTQSKLWDWKMQSEEHKGVFICEKESTDKKKFPEHEAKTLKEFVAFLSEAGIVNPHVECHDLATTYDKSPDGQVTGMKVTVTNRADSCFKVSQRPSNCNAEYDNLGSTLILGAGHAEWDMSTGQHSMGLMCMHDRMSYEETSQLTGIAPLKPGLCLSKDIRVEKNALRQLA